MGRNVEEQMILHGESKMAENAGESPFPSLPKSPNISRPNSMVIKKARTVFPAHLVAEAISTLHHGLELRWSGPITPSEVQYVEQYILAKYPEYCNGLIEEGEKIGIYSLCINDESGSKASTPDHEKKKYSPKTMGTNHYFSTSYGNMSSDLDGIQLEPSKLLDILTKKSSFQGNFISIPEIQVRNRALLHCGLPEDEYLVLFTPTVKEAMIMIGESYPFFRGNYYMTIINNEQDRGVRDFVNTKDSKVIAAPETWLDLRIKGSQLSQYFRRKSKHSPKGLFAYPANVNGTRYSMHWISEAHRNSWHVLLDATELDPGMERMVLAMHRPDFVMCTVDNTHAQPSKITCLLVRRKSFETTPTS